MREQFSYVRTSYVRERNQQPMIADPLSLVQGVDEKCVAGGGRWWQVVPGTDEKEI